MKNILILGAGRSASSTIEYLLDHATQGNWFVTVGDYSLELAQRKVADSPHGKAIRFDVFNEEQRAKEVEKADVVLSLLPASMHVLVAEDCVKYTTSLVTASYISDKMEALDEAAKEAGIILLNEVGVDPGIDHMSAVETIDRIHDRGGKMTAFRSFAGAVVAPESSNLWGYKFTWAPMNVVKAGQLGMAKYRKEGRIKYIPYNRLFKRTDVVEIPGEGTFFAYANRDSLKYQHKYGLAYCPTIYRATLRYPHFCKAWDGLVKIGLTDDTFKMTNLKGLSYRDFLFSFFAEKEELNDREQVAELVQTEPGSEIMERFEWLDLLSHEKKIELETASPAEVLLSILAPKWKFEKNDIDMVVMQHQFEFEMEGKAKRITATMVVRGRDNVDSAIARTVGLPAAMSARMVLEGRIPQTGVHMPNFKEIYLPVLKELKRYGITFDEVETER